MASTGRRSNRININIRLRTHAKALRMDIETTTKGHFASFPEIVVKGNSAKEMIICIPFLIANHISICTLACSCKVQPNTFSRTRNDILVKSGKNGESRATSYGELNIQCGLNNVSAGPAEILENKVDNSAAIFTHAPHYSWLSNSETGSIRREESYTNVSQLDPKQRKLESTDDNEAEREESCGIVRHPMPKGFPLFILASFIGSVLVALTICCLTGLL